ncbi:DnaA N-terminal domain-containing protein [Oceanobacillus sp. Castelsardo]|uniref:DnaA N-terminal domain-containing protein n=1 Tax=Oceanobacillus sp. Castelsardo TaxID=1851204 RepID=UPI000839A96D|nr:DnaA N-terminal domain-containing protein [Oceanobacillus sp. Castelsardo]
MELCSEVLNRISEKISDTSFATWFKKTSAEIENDTIIVYADNEFGKDWLEHNYDGLISETVKGITEKSYSIQYCCKSQESHTYSTSNFYSKQDSIINQLLKRIEQLEARVGRLEDKG